MDRHEADEALRRAIIAHAEAHELVGEQEMLSTWAVASVWMPFDHDGDPRHVYNLHFSGNHMATHEAVGLFETAKTLVLNEEDG